MSLDGREPELDVGFPDWALKLVRCPLTQEELQPADKELVERLQQLLQADRLRNHVGAGCDQKFDAGLVNKSRSYFHLSRAGIQTLIADEAIPIAQLDRLESERSGV